jgi:DNA-binding SARP family transcriptional activator
MDFRILGPLEVSEHGRSVALGGPKQRSVLALLLLHANETVSVDRIVAALWDDPPPTAIKSIQMRVSSLRKDLGADRVRTRAPGYVLRVAPGELDLSRFRDLVDAARAADPADAAGMLADALALWRGDPLADLAYEPFAPPHIARLEELRLAAIEARIEADLAVGRHADLVGEIEALVREHPLRERLRRQLMLALYRSGRQSDALDAYRDAYRTVSDQLGLEPSAELQSLERAILQHDPALRVSVSAEPEPSGCILVFPRALDHPEALLTLAVPLARVAPTRPVVVTGAVAREDVGAATALLARQAAALRADGAVIRTAAFASPTPGADIVRLAARHDADLVLTDAADDPLASAATVLQDAQCDVAVLLCAGGPVRAGPVIVPFGAAEHDWAALELGAWAARALDVPLRLAGATSDERDASRLLADVSLIVQHHTGMAAEPVLAAPGPDGLRALGRDAGLLVVGLSDDWRDRGLGQTRTRLATHPTAPTVLVRRGVGTGGLTPAEPRTRFRWSLTGRT